MISIWSDWMFPYSVSNLNSFSVAFHRTESKHSWRSPCFIHGRQGSITRALCFRFILSLHPGRTPRCCRAAADTAFRCINRSRDTEMYSAFYHRMLGSSMLLTFSAVCTQAVCFGFNGNTGEQIGSQTPVSAMPSAVFEGWRILLFWLPIEVFWTTMK